MNWFNFAIGAGCGALVGWFVSWVFVTWWWNR